MDSSDPRTEQLPAYSRVAQPGSPPLDGTDDDLLLPRYAFPTKFKVGRVFTDGLLVNIDQIKGHLALLDEFSILKAEVDGLDLGIQNIPDDREKRWTWFVGLAVERYVWVSLLLTLSVSDGYRIDLMYGLVP
jgi:hypothetical protein